MYEMLQKGEMKLISVLLSLFSLGAARDVQNGNVQIYEEDYAREFDAFKTRYNRVYTPEDEHENRFNIFKSNLDYIREHNSNDHSYELGLNQYSDITNHEFNLFFKGNLRGIAPSTNITSNFSSVDIAPRIDWRDKGAVNSIKNQKQCGSCYAFSAVTAIESAVAIKTGKLYSLSEQEVVDCDHVDQGCNGGLPSNVFNFVKKAGGLYSTQEYPYEGKNDRCHKETEKFAAIKGFVNVAASRNAIKAALMKGPVSIGINAAGMNFQFYKTGIFKPSFCGAQLDHGVALVGYGDGYFVLRNSWGLSWGDNGYMKIADVDNNHGVCGAYKMVTQPVV